MPIFQAGIKFIFDWRNWIFSHCAHIDFRFLRPIVKRLCGIAKGYSSQVLYCGFFHALKRVRFTSTWTERAFCMPIRGDKH